MIDTLFGSRTRVKLLHLFFNNPSEAFYVREITRKIGEQINSVRRELSNMLDVGVIVSDSSNNKLYYRVNQRYEYYVPLKMMFSEDKTIVKSSAKSTQDSIDKYVSLIGGITDIKVAILSGILVKGSSASIDLMLVGDIPPIKVKSLVKQIEKSENRELNYTTLSYDEFYYRLSIRDKFIIEILNNKHVVAVDRNHVLTEEKEG